MMKRFLICMVCVFNWNVTAKASDEVAMDQFKPEAFVNVIEGYGETGTSTNEGDYFCFSGKTALSSWSYAKDGETNNHIEWTTAPLPSKLNGPRVTFVIPCGLGGEGATIKGVPHDVSINGKPAITIHSSVEGSTLWRRGETTALFRLTQRDGWNDPFGLLLLSVDAKAMGLAAGKPATIRVTGRPSKTLTGSFFMLNHVKSVMPWIESQGGFAKFIAVTSAPTAKRIKRAERRVDSLCLTGNAPDTLAERNHHTGGAYTYYEGRTDADHFPYPSLHLPEGRKENMDEDGRSGGWVPMAEGKMTDGDQGTRVGHAAYLQGSRGIDYVFDLKSEYTIDEITTHATSNHLRNIEVYYKSPGEKRWTLAYAISDRKRFAEGHYPKLTSPQVLALGNTGSARWVRINACFESPWAGFSEVQIWGRPLANNTPPPPKQPWPQAEGEMVVPQPNPIAMPKPAVNVCPVPRHITKGEGRFQFSPATRIALMPGISERTRRTATLLAADLAEERSLTVEIVEGDSSATNAIAFHPITSLSDIGAQGYELTITPNRIDITGVDDLGTFYATQTLMQLIEPSGNSAHVDAMTIRDWPEKPWRSLIAAKPPTPQLLKALARYKITHYMVGESHGRTEGITHREAAADRMIHVVPLVQYNNAWLGNPEEHVERATDEPYESINPGRKNPCPSHPEIWKNYFARIDAVLDNHTEYININMDEMYQPGSGSRWNVCPRCRARNITGHELMADTIEKIHNYIKAHGKKTLMIDSPFWIKGLSHSDDAENDWRKAAEILAEKGLAKEITVYVWHGKSLATRLKSLGFRTLLWCTAIRPEPVGEMYDGIYLAQADAPFRAPYILTMSQHLWSPQEMIAGSSQCTSLIEYAMHDFNRLWLGVQLPSRRADAAFFPIDLKTVANRTRQDDAPFDGKGWVDLGPNYDLRALPSGQQTLAGVPFDILPDDATKQGSVVMVQNRQYFNRELPDQVDIPVGRKAASISFLHTLDDRASQQYWIKQELVGYYLMAYEDGTYDAMELKYAINICNFDGLQTWWDYSPRGEAMERASLAWKGQLGAGNEATLYKADWVNPHPEKVVEKIIFRSPWMPVGVNPILVAATGVTPTASDNDHAPSPHQLSASRTVDRLLTPEAYAHRKAIDLRDGKLESESKWITADGITVECAEAMNNRKSLISTPDYHSNVSVALFDNRQWIRPLGSRSATLTVTFPQPRAVRGVSLLGPYRIEIYQVDRPASVSNWQVLASVDGETFTEIAAGEETIAAEQGPRYVELPNQPLKALRIITPQGERRRPVGLSHIQLYE